MSQFDNTQVLAKRHLAPLGDDGKGNLGLVDVGHLLQRLRLETAEATGETDITMLILN